MELEYPKCVEGRKVRAVRRACWWNSHIEGRKGSRIEGRKMKATRRARWWTPVLVATGRRLWEGCADEALTPTVTRQRSVEWMCCSSFHPVSKEGKRTAMLESVGRQDKKDKMVDSLETEAWLTQYQLLWPWLTQCQLLWPAQSKSGVQKKKKKYKDKHKEEWEREKMPATAEEKKKKKKRNGAQFPLTRKTLSLFIGVALARNPCNL